MTEDQVKPYWKRFLIAFAASAILVFTCSLSMQLHSLRDPEWVLVVALGVAIASIPGAAIASLVAPRSPFLLILGSQVLTVTALVVWFAVRG
jgi:hypothetical protein